MLRSPLTRGAQLIAACDMFKDFYMTKHTGRRLTWQTNQGSADVKTLFTPKQYELSVSTYQLCILMLFNGCDEISLTYVPAKAAAPLYIGMGCLWSCFFWVRNIRFILSCACMTPPPPLGTTQAF